MATTGQRLPVREALIEKASALLRMPWIEWFDGLRTSVDRGATRVADAVQVTGQSAAIGATAIATYSALSAGVYRVSVWTRVTTVAGVSSSVQPTIHYTSGGVSCTEVGTNNNGNVTNLPQSDTFLIDCDAASPVSFSTAYASNPASAMVYAISVTIEKVDA